MDVCGLGNIQNIDQSFINFFSQGTQSVWERVDVPYCRNQITVAKNIP